MAKSRFIHPLIQWPVTLEPIEILARYQDMEPVARGQWLKANTLLASLSEGAIAALAQAIEERTIGENYRLVLEDTRPEGMYILYSGRLERYRTSKTGLANAVALLPGTVLHLPELVLDRVVSQTVITLSECVLWVISPVNLQAIARQYPELMERVSQQLAEELTVVSSQLLYEQEQDAALRPYLVPKVRRGIIGTSRYAVRLRQEVKQAAQDGDRRPVLIFGEPGLGKDNTAALIHFGSPDRREPMVKVNCALLQASGSDLFGRSGGKPGLLDWLGRGSLLLNNVQDLPPSLRTPIQTLVTTGNYTPIERETLNQESIQRSNQWPSSPGPSSPRPSSPRHSDARIFMVSERILPEFSNKQTTVIALKIPPLRVRKEDITAQANYYLTLFCRSRGIVRPNLTPEAKRSLQNYDFPGNLSELETLLERAVIQADGAPELTEDVLWSFGNKERRFRFNLLNAYPKLREFLRSPWWPDRLNYGFTFGFFGVVVAMLILGPQTRDHNIALTLFWAWWWPVILVAFLFVGRLWCSICPFMIYGELAQRLSLKIFPRELLSWPRQTAERWGGWFLMGLFTLILLWEELWNLENTAYLSGCLLLLITAGAVIFSVLFERRFWCRYLCPIGGMNGLFAKLSMTELRARQGVCSATCTTYQCYKGGPQKGEGQETEGCPLYSHPAQLQDNRDCVLCMTCLKACPHRSVEVNLRPPGIELWTTHRPTLAEVALLFLLFGAVFLHRLPEILALWNHSVLLQSFGWHGVLSLGALGTPGAIALLAHGLMKGLNRRCKPRPFIELAYGYLPLVLGGNLAHYLRLGLTEGGQIIPVTLATFGLTGTSGVSGIEGAVAIAHPAVLAFLQGVTLIVSFWLSVVLTQKIACQPFFRLLPQHLAAVVIGVGFWKVIVG